MSPFSFSPSQNALSVRLLRCSLRQLIRLMLQQQKLLVGGVSAAAGFRFYKIVITAITSGSSVVLGNVELLVAGSNVIPVMSGYTSPSPNVVSVSGDASGNFGWHATRNDKVKV